MGRIFDTFPDPLWDPKDDHPSATIVLAGGCFWCTEGVFREVPGVESVVSGYAGGTAETANYDDVCGGDTNHAEAIAITYNPAQISLGQILKIFFWLAHDPTQVGGQAYDMGPVYRSAIFFADDKQKTTAEKYIAQINAAQVFDKPIATTLEPLTQFFPGEAYHQNYAALHPQSGYVRAIAQPKIDKTRKVFGKSAV